jgi:hypothetical protein
MWNGLLWFRLEYSEHGSESLDLVEGKKIRKLLSAWQETIWPVNVAVKNVKRICFKKSLLSLCS